MMRRHLARLLAATAVLVTATLSPTAALASDASPASISSRTRPIPPPTCSAWTETSPATDFSARLSATLAAGGLIPGELRVRSRGTRCTAYLEPTPKFRPERAMVGIYLTTDGIVDGAALGDAAALVLDAGQPIVPAAQLDAALGVGDPGIEIVLRGPLREVTLASTWDGLAAARARGLSGQALVDAAPAVPPLVVPGAHPNPSHRSCLPSTCL
jgi:hypothetical protein